LKTSKKIKDIPVIILCGGKGTRMGPITEKTPKPLIQIKDKPIIWYIVLSLYRDGYRRFVLPLGYKGEAIKYYANKYLSNLSGIEFDFIETGENSEIATRIKIVLEQKGFDHEILLLNGDAVFDFNLSEIYQKHISSGSLISLISVEIRSQWGLILENDQRIEGFVREQKVKYISASDNEKDNKGYIYSGIAFININTFKKINLEKSKDFECDLYSKFIKSGQLSNIKANGFWFSIDTPKDITLISNEQGHIGKHLKRIGENIMEYLNLKKRTV
jgi:glucose-1-phosphate cytidylyltransferase